MRRVLVGGISGVGKTTFARELAARTRLPYHEMDALYHGPGWVKRPEFDDDVAAIAAQDAWVFDSHGYQEVRQLVWSRADTVVWLDLSRPVVLRRVLTRSFDRAWNKKATFNGNTEGFSRWLDPEHPVQWSMRMYRDRQQQLAAMFADPAYAAITKVHLRTRAAADDYLATLVDLRGRGRPSRRRGR